MTARLKNRVMARNEATSS